MPHLTNCHIVFGKNADLIIVDEQRDGTHFWCITHWKGMWNLAAVEVHMDDKSKFGDFRKVYEKYLKEQTRLKDREDAMTQQDATIQDGHEG